MLNQPIELSAPILSTLAKARETIELMLELGLGHLPLGMPLCLLSQSETRILRVLQALRAATPQKPAIIVLEEPEIGFRRPALAALERVRSTHEKSKNCVWIEVRAGANAERRN
jgi:excinuclease UvrABC ATPase subunit